VTAMVEAKPLARAWSAEEAVARAEAVALLEAATATEPAATGIAGDRLLKRGPRSTVVWLEDAGPEGTPVVVKTFVARRGGRRAGIGRPPAQAQLEAARALRAAGIETPVVHAAVDRGWPKAPCHVISAAVADGSTLLEQIGRVDRRGRYRLARALGDFVARLHLSGWYVPDLKHENLLVRSHRSGAPLLVLIDLERARRPRLGVSARRRLRNLVQLHWRLSWESTPREQVAFLAAYRAVLGSSTPLADLAKRVDRARRRKQRSLLGRRRRAGVTPSERPGLSCMIICQNEKAQIRDCLESVRWCDEIVVIDAFSVDGTDAICREYTDCVIQRPWPGHRAQKQFALDQTTQPWVLNIDADERVPAPLRAEIEMLLAHDGAGYDGFQVPRLVRYMGRWWWRAGWYPSRRLRLFRRERTSWGGVDPHEKAIVQGPIGRVHEPLWHLTYGDVAHHLRSIDHLTDVAARARPRPASADRLLLRPPARLLRSWVIGRGLLEGFPGFFVALSSAFYVHVKHAKADERWREEQAKKGPDDAPAGRGEES